jgi:hypothetical protein
MSKEKKDFQKSIHPLPVRQPSPDKDDPKQEPVEQSDD